jgi:hypothetical protein
VISAEAVTLPGLLGECGSGGAPAAKAVLEIQIGQALGPLRDCRRGESDGGNDG